MAEFLGNGGDVDEYAEMVFRGEVFGSGTDPVDESLDVYDARTLAEQLDALAIREGIITADLCRDWRSGNIAVYSTRGVLEQEDVTELAAVFSRTGDREPVDLRGEANSWLTSNGYRQLTDWAADERGYHLLSVWIWKGAE